MIIRWMRKSPTEYVGQWQGLVLSLVEVSQRNWAVSVDGARTKERWHTPLRAMADVDAAMGRVVIREAATARATQRPLSAERIVRHVVSSTLSDYAGRAMKEAPRA